MEMLKTFILLPMYHRNGTKVPSLRDLHVKPSMGDTLLTIDEA
jgi:hypothetical protein